MICVSYTFIYNLFIGYDTDPVYNSNENCETIIKFSPSDPLH